MAKLYLTASAVGGNYGTAVLVVSVADADGAPTTKLKAKAFTIKALTFATKDYGLEQVNMTDFYEESDGFYTMTLEDTTVNGSSAHVSGSGVHAITISVKIFKPVFSPPGQKPPPPVPTYQGYITINY
jgi:hypothetical protein